MANGANHINFVVRGTHDPTLIFVHGFACSLDDWEEQVSGLSPRFRCVALDLPGHGDSAKPDTTSIEIMGTAVNCVKDRIAARSTILVGHSMGCRVITEAFQQSGPTVSGLVFVDGSVLGYDLQSTRKSVRAAIDRAGMDAFTQTFFSDMFLDSGDPELRERPGCSLP
jgi:pimeloyl-ACP methyl ester carboxylesterase